MCFPLVYSLTWNGRTTKCEDHPVSCRVNAQSPSSHRSGRAVHSEEAPTKQGTTQGAKETPMDKIHYHSTIRSTREGCVPGVAKGACSVCENLMIFSSHSHISTKASRGGQVSVDAIRTQSRSLEAIVACLGAIASSCANCRCSQSAKI